jgi:hypothetical protein
MTKKPAKNPFDPIRKTGTGAPNYGLDTNAIIERLTKWQSLCSFSVTGAKGDTVDIEFATLPKDMDAFVKDLYEFCPDLVDQGTGCLHEFIGVMEEEGKELTPQMKKLIEGVDLEKDDYGLEILKREIQQHKNLKLWWD